MKVLNRIIGKDKVSSDVPKPVEGNQLPMAGPKSIQVYVFHPDTGKPLGEHMVSLVVHGAPIQRNILEGPTDTSGNVTFTNVKDEYLAGPLDIYVRDLLVPEVPGVPEGDVLRYSIGFNEEKIRAKIDESEKKKGEKEAEKNRLAVHAKSVSKAGHTIRASVVYTVIGAVILAFAALYIKSNPSLSGYLDFKATATTDVPALPVPVQSVTSQTSGMLVRCTQGVANANGALLYSDPTFKKQSGQASTGTILNLYPVRIGQAVIVDTTLFGLKWGNIGDFMPQFAQGNLGEWNVAALPSGCTTVRTGEVADVVTFMNTLRPEESPKAKLMRIANWALYPVYAVVAIGAIATLMEMGTYPTIAVPLIILLWCMAAPYFSLCYKYNLPLPFYLFGFGVLLLVSVAAGNKGATAELDRATEDYDFSQVVGGPVINAFLKRGQPGYAKLFGLFEASTIDATWLGAVGIMLFYPNLTPFPALAVYMSPLVAVLAMWVPFGVGLLLENLDRMFSSRENVLSHIVVPFMIVLAGILSGILIMTIGKVVDKWLIVIGLILVAFGTGVLGIQIMNSTNPTVKDLMRDISSDYPRYYALSTLFTVMTMLILG